MEPTICAYIAGFLDGDGSIFFQLIRKPDYRFGFQIRSSVAFYQKTDNERVLRWLKEQLICGSMRRRRTGISDYTIVEGSEVKRILSELQPYIVLKREHVRLGLAILEELPGTVDPQDYLSLCRRVDRFGDLNYSKKRTITSDVVEAHLRKRGLLRSPPGEVAEPPVAWRRPAGREHCTRQETDACSTSKGRSHSPATRPGPTTSR